MLRKILNLKNLLVYGTSLLVLVLLVIVRQGEPAFLKETRSLTFDYYQQIRPRKQEPTPVRIVDIDEDSLQKLGQWPWPRTRISKLIDNLTEMGAASIGFDVVFSETDRTTGSQIIRQLEEIEWPDRKKLEPMLNELPDNDRMLAFSMQRSPVVLGFFYAPTTQAKNNKVDRLPLVKAKYAFAGDDPKEALWPIANSIPPLDFLQDSAVGIGLANPSPDKTGDRVRKVAMFVTNSRQIYPSLSVETLRIALQASTFVIRTNSASGEFGARELALTSAKVGDFSMPLTANGDFNVYYAPEDPRRYISAERVLNSSPRELKALFDGHIVLIGASAPGLEDLRTSALGQTIPGVAVHAQVIDQVLTGNFLSRPDWALGVEQIAMIVGSLLLLILLPFAGAYASALLGLLLVILMVWGSWLGFSQHGLLLDPLFPIIAMALVYLLSTITRYAVSENERRFVRSAFQRYLAPDLLTQLERNPQSLKLGGETRNLTLMFMDIRGFTPISENLTPEELVTFLNDLLSPLSEVILETEGAIDKYIGDSIMAFWNAPLDVEDHPKKAALAALKMIEITQKLNKEDRFGFHSSKSMIGDVAIGIGINTGIGCVGNLGSTERFDYSVVGDTVNVAARIESSCKKAGWHLLLSKSTADACADLAILKAGVIELKGKSEPAPLYALLGDEEYAATQTFKDHQKAHQQLAKHMDTLNWLKLDAKARRLITECQAKSSTEFAPYYDNLEADLNAGDT